MTKVKTSAKILVEDEHQTYLSSNLQDIARDFQHFLEAYGPEAYVEFDEGSYITIRYKRLETDREYEGRIKRTSILKEKDKVQKLKKAEEEKKLYEKLKAKYDPSV